MILSLTEFTNRLTSSVGSAYKTEVNKMYDDLRIHAEGLDAGSLISERRPTESDYNKAYRQKIQVAITKPVVSQIYNTLQKIRKSQDWAIRFPSPSPKIEDKQSLEEYCMKYLPLYGSIEMWMFNATLMQMLIDTNGIIAWLPYNVNVQEDEYIKPYPVIFNCNSIVDYISGQYYIVKEKRKSALLAEGNSYLCITDDTIQRFEQSEKGYVETLTYEHELSMCPVVELMGVYKDIVSGRQVKESRISSIVPFLKEAIREYSDLQIGVVKNLHSKEWIYNMKDCTNCNGTGIDTKRTTKIKTCMSCGGTGRKTINPADVVVIEPPQTGSTVQAPTPPGGYFPIQPEIIEIQDRRIDAHIYKALSSINFQHLAAVPLAQSGIAKEWDRDEANAFMNAICEDIVYTLDASFKIISKYRYGLILREEDVDMQCPKINIPERFDLANSKYYMEEIDAARKSGVSGIIIKNLEYEYAQKKFNADSSVLNSLMIAYNLDPMPADSLEDKIMKFQNKACTEENFIMSCNISYFVNRAIAENKDFAEMPQQRQREIIVAYAQEITDLNKFSTKLNEPDDGQGDM